MEISSEYLADLLIGIAKAQAAVVDAMERASPGFRSTHAVPLLQIAANMRAGDPRLVDLPSRVLLRTLGRVAPDNNTVRADLERLNNPQPEPSGGAPGGAPGGASGDAAGATGENLDFSANA